MDARDRFRGSILGLAIGDALGREVEFETDPALLVVSDLPEDALYTDDTQMAVCVAEALVESKGEGVEKFMAVLSRKFVEWYVLQSEPHFCRAPGNTCMEGCKRLASGMGWEVSGLNSLGCGSAMRSPPVGLFHCDNIPALVEFSKESCRATHNNLTSMCAAVGAAMMPALAMKDVPVGVWAHEIVSMTSGVSAQFCDIVSKAALLSAQRVPPMRVMSRGFLGESWHGHEAVASALFCCMTHPNDYKKAVLTAVNTVGDSDSIGAITGAAMGARLGLAGIPPEWVSRIEDSAALMGLADKLFEAATTRPEEGKDGKDVDGVREQP